MCCITTRIAVVLQLVCAISGASGDFTAWRHPSLDSRGRRLWTWEQLQSGIATWDFRSVQPLVRKLQAGLPITAIAIGSSITQDNGGSWCTGPDHTLAARVNVSQLIDWGQKDRCAERPGFLRQFMFMVNTSWPHPQHVLLNYGRAGCFMPYFAELECLPHFLPSPLDLIIIELIPGEAGHYMEAVLVRFFEYYKWQGTALPTIVLVHAAMFIDWKTSLQAHGALADPHRCATRFSESNSSSLFPETITGPDFRGAPNTYGYFTQEHDLHRLAQYYSLPLLSTQAFHAAAIRAGIHKAHSLSICQYVAEFTGDGLHLRPESYLLWADLLYAVIHMEQQRQLAAATLGLAPAPRPRVRLPARPLWAWPRKLYKCGLRKQGLLEGAADVQPGPGWQWVELQEAETPASQASRPAAAGGVGRPAGATEQTIGTSHSATAMAEAAKVRKRKPGWLSRTVNTTLGIKILTGFPSPRVQISLLRLVSYKHMGLAGVRCAGDCSCTPSTFDGHILEHVSVTRAHTFMAHAPHACLVEVTVLNSTNSGEHKVKIIGVQVSMPLAQ